MTDVGTTDFSLRVWLDSGRSQARSLTADTVAAGLRFRAILMTAFSLVLGVFLISSYPLVIQGLSQKRGGKRAAAMAADAAPAPPGYRAS